MNTQLTFPIATGQSLAEQVEHSIAVLRTYEPKGGEYYGCFSGGKDSCVIKELARMAGVRVTWHYNVTTIDPPELYRFIRREHPDVVWEYPKRHFFALVVANGYPTRTARSCCEEFKESKGRGVLITGIRAAESPRRAKAWKELSRWRWKKATRPAAWLCNPILTWSDCDVWEFIRGRSLPYCGLYDEGWKRLGCIGCPMGGAKQIQAEFARWPQYERAWRRAFHRLWERRRGTVIKRGKRKGRPWPGFPSITSADELFEWWKSGTSCPDKNDQSNDCQGRLFR